MRNRTGLVAWCTRIRQICVLYLCLFTSGEAQQLNKISGIVSDSSGAAIQHASIEFSTNGDTVRTATDATGSFTLLSTQTYGTLSVSSPGFSSVRLEVAQATEPLRIKLEPAGVIERILITSHDERIPSTPTSQFALTGGFT